jgi:cyanophycinase
MIPKGKLIAIGGAENKGTEDDIVKVQSNNHNFSELGILRRIVTETGKENPQIVVITTASTIPVEVGQNYLNAFTKIGCTNIVICDIRNREDAANETYAKLLESCDAIMFSGGNQMRLSSIFGGTQFLKIITNRYINENFLIAGTSAGAMAMSNTMIYEGNAAKAHLKGEVKVTTGLALMDDVIFDSHFEKRGRFARLAQVVAANPGCIGIGLGEDTGMLITEGNKMEAIGSGLVMIIDGHKIQHCNIADISEGNPISIENLTVHFCEMGNGFIVDQRKFIPEVYEGAVIKKPVEVL